MRLPERIALYVPSMRGGGAERVLLDLANDFANRGLEVDLVLVNAEGPYLPKVSPNVRIIDLKCSRALTSCFGLVRYLRRERPAALLSTIGHTNQLALVAKLIARVPIRVVVRESNVSLAQSEPNLLKKIMRFISKRLYLYADAIVAPSHGVASNFCERFCLPRECVTVIYNPVVSPEIARLAELPASHPWFGSGQPVVLAAGRLTQQKNFSSLIRAFAHVKTHRPAKLVILGEGQERQTLTDLISELGIKEDVALVGFVQNPFAYMKRSNVFVLCSLWEGLPNVLIQAMALGTPVVATNCRSGPDEILEGGKYGPLVQVDDVEHLSEAILNVLDSPTLPVDEDWLRRFSKDAVTLQFLEVLGVNEVVSLKEVGADD